MSYISVMLVVPLDFQRQSCLFWILLKDTLSASSLSVGAMSCGMLLEMKQLFNWSVSVGDISFWKPADFFGGLSRRSWVLHFLKNLTLIHYSYSLKFKLNCQHFHLPLLFSVDKALWFVLSLFCSFYSVSITFHSFATDRILLLYVSPFEYCGGFVLAICHWQFGISCCISNDSQNDSKNFPLHFP